MKPVLPRNKAAEREFWRMLMLWEKATANHDEMDEKSLRWLFEKLESAYKKVGYDFGRDHFDKLETN